MISKEDLSFEPIEEGLVIATKNTRMNLDRTFQGKPNSRVFLWFVGRPRTVHEHPEPIWELENHNGNLLTVTYKNAPLKQKIGDGIFIRNLTTNENLPHHAERLCSHNGKLHITTEIYHPERHLSGWPHSPEEYRRAREFTETTLNSVNPDGLEPLITKNALVKAMVSTPQGIIASITEEPRGEQNRIINLETGESFFSRGFCRTLSGEYDFTGYDGGAVLSLCTANKDVLFSDTTHRNGVYTLSGKRIAYFTLIDWLREKEEKTKEVPEGEERRHEMRKLEGIAEEMLGYSYERGLGAESDFFAESCWNAAAIKKGRTEPSCMHRRIALSSFIEGHFFIRYMAYFNGCLMLASHRDLYAVPLTQAALTSDKPIEIKPLEHKVWTFHDNVCGMTLVSGEALKQLKSKADIRIKSCKGSEPRYSTQTPARAPKYAMH